MSLFVSKIEVPRDVRKLKKSVDMTSPMSLLVDFISPKAHVAHDRPKLFRKVEMKLVPSDS